MIGGCSGVLIAERAVLSAWHCFEDDEGRWIAAAGSVANNRHAFRVTRDRARRLSLPAGAIDVGVYCLDRPAPMMSLPVISREAVRKDESLDVVGFGLVGGAPVPPAASREVLPRQGTTKVESVATIAGVPRFITARGGPESGAQSVACHGDSGGPVYRRGTLELVGMTEKNPTDDVNAEACGMPMQSVHLAAIRMQVEAAVAACSPR